LTVAAANLGVAESALSPLLQLPDMMALTSAGLGGGVLNIVSASLAVVLDVALYDGGARNAGVDLARSRVREASCTAKHCCKRCNKPKPRWWSPRAIANAAKHSSGLARRPMPCGRQSPRLKSWG
jgi:hypothetical protein